jgi:Domain of unknown function (DUF1906)
MAVFLDYSARTIPGAAIKAAGYAGAVRYIDHPANLGHKHTTRAEYADHLAHGLTVLLVFEGGTDDMRGGFAAGVSNARRALAGARWLGYPDGLPLFLCADRHATAAENAAHWPAWRAYLDGAASVLGLARTGAYGFGEALDSARGHATWFWQCGSRRDLHPYSHMYQRNTGYVTVGGVQCDVNDLMIPMEDDMPYGDWPMDDRNKLVRDVCAEVIRQLGAQITEIHDSVVPPKAEAGKPWRAAVWNAANSANASASGANTKLDDVLSRLPKAGH